MEQHLVIVFTGNWLVLVVWCQHCESLRVAWFFSAYTGKSRWK